MSTGLFDGNPENPCSQYVAARSGTRYDQKRARANCEDLWRTYEPYADEHFRAEFPRRFHQRWFEMWLAAFLLRAGHEVECRKPGPDIRIQLNGRTVWIEAVCATAGEEGKKDSVPKPVHGRVVDTPTNAYALRVTNALSGKAEQFQRNMEDGIVREDDLVVIAINVHDVGLGPYLRDVMKLALYGSGNLVFRIDRHTKELVDTRHEEVNSISKESTGAAVGVRPFVDDSIPHVSAAWGFLGCAANYSPDIAADCIQSPNLTGKNRWLEGKIAMGREWYFREGQAELKGELR